MSEGVYDPDLFVAADPGTWPRPALGGDYLAGMFWELDPPGDWDGTPTVHGDRAYVIGTDRTYGLGTYGAGDFGDIGEWIDAQVSWALWSAFRPAWYQDPPPFSGCEFLDGWRIVVEALFNANRLAHLYGTDLYGSNVYGDAAGGGAGEWEDITSIITSSVAVRGNTTEQWVVPVDGLSTQAIDDANVFPINPDPVVFGIEVGTVLRVGFLDPLSTYWPVSVARVERIEDRHDGAPRDIEVESFGIVSDLVQPVQLNRTAESVTSRLLSILSSVRYAWAPPVFPASPGPNLIAMPSAVTATARELLDQIGISVGWSLSVNNRGIPVFSTWPLANDPTNAIQVADCAHDPDHLVATNLVFVADTAELVNYADWRNIAPTPAQVTIQRDPSVARYGVQGDTLGMPFPDAHSDLATMTTVANRVLDRQQFAVRRCVSFDADVSVDSRWLPVLASLDRGTPVTIHRTEGTDPTSFTGHVIGIEHRITRAVWSATVYLSAPELTSSRE